MFAHDGADLSKESKKGEPDADKSGSPLPDFGNQSGPGGWAVLKGSERKAPVSSVVKGELDSNSPITVDLMLKSRASDRSIDDMVAKVAAGKHAPLSNLELAKMFGPTRSSIAALEIFAKRNGLLVGNRDQAGRLFELKGTAEQMQKAFGVNLRTYENDAGQTFRAFGGSIRTSPEIAPYLESVLGLDKRPAFKTQFIRTAALKAGSGPKDQIAYDPEQAFKAYNFPADLKGDGLRVSFSSLGGVLPNGFDKWLAKHGGTGGIDVRILDGQELQSDPDGADVENALDAGLLKIGLPNAHVTMYAGDNSTLGFIQTVEHAGEDGSAVHSISWGNNEENWANGDLKSMSEAIKMAALQGTTVLTASGDDGARDNSSSGRLSVDVPSDTAAATSVGGTKLIIAADGSRQSEVAWSSNGATGGGISEKVPRPDYQKDLKLPANANGVKFDGKGVPDIAFMASPETAWKVFTENGEQGVGGTSAAAPAAAVLFGKAAQAIGRNLGNANEILYKMAKSDPEVFHDIKEGDNGGYIAAPGWDATTGLGSLDGARFIDALKNKRWSAGKLNVCRY